MSHLCACGCTRNHLEISGVSRLRARTFVNNYVPMLFNIVCLCLCVQPVYTFHLVVSLITVYALWCTLCCVLDQSWMCSADEYSADFRYLKKCARVKLSSVLNVLCLISAAECVCSCPCAITLPVFKFFHRRPLMCALCRGLCGGL